jgi:cyanophycinase
VSTPPRRGIPLLPDASEAAPERRFARDPFAGAEAGRHGPVMAIGGAEDKLRDKVILRAFLALAGGERARVAIVPTASSIEHAGERYKALFYELGADEVDVVYLADRADANGDAPIGLLADATGIFLTGGNQMRLAAIVGGYRVDRMLRERNDAGAVVAGNCAGASILSSHMVAFGASGPVPRLRMAQMTAGFGLVPETIVDQHFRQRDRFGRLLALVAASPGLLGVGVDEDTAAIFDADGVLEVLGRHSVTIVDGTHLVSDVFQVKGHGGLTISNAILHVLTAGHRFDTRERVLVE